MLSEWRIRTTEVYYNIWNVDTDKWLLSDCV